MTAMFLIALFAGIGLPGFSGFIGEFLSLLGTFQVERTFAIVATTGVVLAAVYSLWAFQRAFTGKPSGENAKLRDVTIREVVVVVPLLALSLFLGLYPKPALDRIEPSVRRAVADLEAKSDYREPDLPKAAKKVVGARAAVDHERNGDAQGGGRE
jgi:NADH-quinone oxidoreductase subunit M